MSFKDWFLSYDPGHPGCNCCMVYRTIVYRGANPGCDFKSISKTRDWRSYNYGADDCRVNLQDLACCPKERGDSIKMDSLRFLLSGFYCCHFYRIYGRNHGLRFHDRVGIKTTNLFKRIYFFL